MALSAEKIKAQSLAPYKQKNRPVYCVMWIDPRTAARRNSSLGTREETEAKQVCVDLERIFKTPILWDATATDPRLNEFHPRAVEIFFGFKPEDVKSSLEITIKQTSATPARKYYAGKHGRGFRQITVPVEQFDDERRGKIEAEREASNQKQRVLELEKENLRLSRKLNLHCKATLAEAIAKYKEHYPAGHAPITVRHAFSVIDHFAGFVGDAKLLGELDHNHIDDWLVEYKNRRRQKESAAEESRDAPADDDAEGLSVSQVTKAKNKRYLSTFFSWAFRKYDLSENPIAKTLPVAGVDRNPENIIAIRSYEGLVEFLDALKPWPYWRAWAAVACLAGPRWSEQCWLKAKDVYLKNGYLRVTTRTGGRNPTGTKTGRERNVPIEQTILRQILEEHERALKKTETWLFPGPSELKTTGGRWRENAQFLSAWRRVAAEANSKTDGAAEYWHYGPAEWRHTAATAMGHSGLSALQISQWIGNSESVCHRHYISPVGPNRWPLNWGS